MKYERAKKFEVSHYEQLKLVEKSLLWSLSMYKEQENGYKEAQERQD